MTNVPTFMMNIPSSYDTAVRNNVWMEEYDDEDIIVNKPKAIPATCRSGFLFGLFTERRFARIVQPAHCRVRKTVRRFCERYDFVA